MKKPRVPYAKRSVWIAIAILSLVLVVGFGLAGYEIHHLQNEVNGLNNAVATLYQQFLKLAK
jgi:hypothetical protein